MEGGRGGAAADGYSRCECQEWRVGGREGRRREDAYAAGGLEEGGGDWEDAVGEGGSEGGASVGCDGQGVGVVEADRRGGREGGRK